MKISEILTKHGTDKNNWNGREGHCFGETYDQLFSKFERDSSINILEIGVQNGNSIGAWKEAFPNAFVCGIDIKDVRNPEYRKEELCFILGDVKNPSIKAQVSDKKFDIMIDDGSHHLPDVIHFITHYLDLLSDNGYMIIEDTQHPNEWINAIQPLIPQSHEMYVKDLRPVHNRYDDFLIIIRKK